MVKKCYDRLISCKIDDLVIYNIEDKMIDIKDLKVNLDALMSLSEKVIIVPHKEADFDALGSAIGLALYAKKSKKQAYILLEDSLYKLDRGVQLVVEASKSDFPLISKNKYLAMRSDNDLTILTDVNKKYLIHLEETLLNPEKTIIIDHHDPDDMSVEAKHTYIDTKVSSASEIVTKLLCMGKVRMTPEVADYLLAGIYLDTNKLSKNVSSETFKTVAKLFEWGATLNRVSDLFVEDFASDRKVQELINQSKIMNFSVAVASGNENVTYTKEELAKVADYLLRYRVDASFAIGSIDEKTVSISARSKEKVNVGCIMQQLGGGGNPFSGATKIEDKSIQEVEKELIKTIKPPCFSE